MENYSIQNNEDTFLIRNRNESIYIEFVLQAIYNPSSKEIKYYEILSRIISSSGENYNNEDFFENIDDTFLKMIAICQLKEAKRLSINKPISINLTLSCLLDTDFINELIDRKNIGLAIEINDINSNFDCDLLFENIKKLQRSNIEIWLDDYHENHKLANLSLGTINWDKIKIDKSFLHYNDYDIEAIRSLCFVLRPFTRTGFIFEGVETYYQERLVRLSGSLSQGYFHSYPEKWSKHLSSQGYKHDKEKEI
ncbi:TPA: EAL domain-containing protein [Vibrio vulnificus]|uniref:EAL domain-containing protein n=2 Tax=Vibrio vulnificus TaxID=672 RepID=UPI000D73C210|nr:EAL domain-containing protein [Vibrio vulnificus]PWY30348.1 hypothetical protein VV86_20990 [Vibrio vulnificus]HAS6025777.1 EAL domain-containing protein [Vibrio vulnificus]HAS6035561.1 EAL domain-containing protein [Vibrio vulnificus]HDY7858994.1 EAL domain-containing protein [Vibrio vulnificus]HDY8048693.1 EAL domain-containing protein [Vibrio vulnificus]